MIGSGDTAGSSRGVLQDYLGVIRKGKTRIEHVGLEKWLRG